MSPETLSRYWQTVRWLRPVQVYGRLWFRLHRARPDLRPAPTLRWNTRTWTPCARAVSMMGPDSFRFLNVERCIASDSDWNRPEWPKLWLYNAHYFNDLVAADARILEAAALTCIESPLTGESDALWSGRR